MAQATMQLIMWLGAFAAALSTCIQGKVLHSSLCGMTSD
jgi:hypothetical protein